MSVDATSILEWRSALCHSNVLGCELGLEEWILFKRHVGGIVMGFFDGVFITLECPNCNYSMDVELLSVQLEAIVFCPCCKATVQLVDGDASLHGAQEEADSAIKDFTEDLKKLNKTIRIEI